jgi:GNAT superfamily N-acetyltransferase
MQISYLVDHPDFIDVLAPWIYAHWQSLKVDASLAMRVAKLKTHLNKDTLPIALVAHAGNEVFGMAALRVHDLPGREDLTPWLGGVFVGVPYRGRGIGTHLCTAVDAKAKLMFPAQPLYLFTLDKQRWYQKMGWSFCESCFWCGHAGTIMNKLPT